MTSDSPEPPERPLSAVSTLCCGTRGLLAFAITTMWSSIIRPRSATKTSAFSDSTKQLMATTGCTSALTAPTTRIPLEAREWPRGTGAVGGRGLTGLNAGFLGSVQVADTNVLHLSADQQRVLIATLKRAIDADRFPLSPRDGAEIDSGAADRRFPRRLLAPVQYFAPPRATAKQRRARR